MPKREANREARRGGEPASPNGAADFLPAKPCPLLGEIAACMPWLRMEIDLVRPEIIVCLGATAGQALFGSRFSVTRERGRFLASSYAPFVLATLHPSALLRIIEPDERHAAFEHFVADLRLVHDAKPKLEP